MTDWPDWRGQTAAIIASGPSAKKANVAILKGIVKVLAIKKNIELAPFADVVYGCDGPWWRSVNGLPAFKGLKLAYDDRIVGPEFGIEKVKIPNIKKDDLLFDEVGTIGAGGNSGFQALNLVLQFGASRILLIGFDANGAYGNEHWYGRNNWYGTSNPDENNYRRWRSSLDNAAAAIVDRGIEVINASMDSSIKSFKKMSVEDALNKWEMKIAA